MHDHDAEGGAPPPSPDAAGSAEPGEPAAEAPEPEPEPDPPEERPDEHPEASADAPPDATGRSFATVVNQFFGGVDAAGSTFGAALGSRAAAGSGAKRPATGSVRQSELDDALDHYVTPPPYDRALQALHADGVVMLTGHGGTGKRAGAISLLRETTGGPLWTLSPATTLESLAARSYNKGAGYVVIDHFEPARRDRGDEAKVAAFDWQRVCGRVREEGAWLVVTAAPARESATGPVQVVPWEAPGPERILRARLVGTAGEAVLDAALEAIPETWTMADLVRFAGGVAAGGDVAAAAEEAFGLAARLQVRAWFDGGPTRRQIVEITALAFVLGVGEREFEAHAGALGRELERHVPAPPPAGSPAEDGDAEPASAPGPAADVLPQYRGARITPGGLLKLQRHTGGGTPRRFLSFKTPVHRRYVLAELWDRFDGSFWDAVDGWLDEVAGEPGAHVAVAEGLALLSYECFDEVEAGHLHGWAGGGRLPPHPETAILTLWYMCLDETLASAALHTATRWVCYGTAAQRLSGARAFAGQVGVRYPEEAVRRLWQLIAQDTAISPPVARAMGQLFATLTSYGEGAGKVLRFLDGRLRGLSPTGPERRRYGHALATALEVLSVRAPGTTVPSIAIFLGERPDRLDLAASVWGAALRHRPGRRAALLALWDVLRSLEHRVNRMDGDEPAPDIELVRALGNALAAHLPGGERELLRRDLGRIALDVPTRRQGAEVLTEVLLKALEKAAPHDETESGGPV